jgi:hypothetical protein
MPKIKDYESKNIKARRRPGREQETPVMEVTEDVMPEPHSDSSPESNPQRKKIHIEFPFSEAVRAKVPKVFKIAENVAEEWVNDGNFENVPVGHPLAQISVAAGLRKAKEVEKKLAEKGVFMIAKMGLEYAKSKLNKK